MPKYSDEKLKGRTPLDSYEISKQLSREEKLTVSANRIDAFVSPVKQATNIQLDPDAVAVVKSLENVNNSVSSFVKLQEAFKPENEAKAKADRMQNKYDDSTDNFLNLNAGYSEKWRTLDGEAKMAKAATEAKRELEANKFFINDADPLGKQNATIQKHYESAGIDPKDTYAMAGASYAYKELQVANTDGYNKVYWEKVKTDHINNVGSLADTVISGYREKMGDKSNPTDLRNLLGGLRYSIDANVVPPEEQGQVIVDQVINYTYQKIKNLNADGRFEEAAALKEDVLLALRTPDRDGVMWSQLRDKEGKRVLGNAIDSAESAFNNTIEQAESRFDAKNQKIFSDNHGLYLGEMYNTRDRKELAGYRATLDQALADNELDGQHHAEAIKTLNNLLNSDSAVIEDPNRVFAFRANIFTGKFGIKDVDQALRDGEINRSSADWALGLLERMKAKQDSLAAEGRQREFMSWQMRYQQGHSYLLNRFGKDDIETYGQTEDYYNALVDKGEDPSAARAKVIKEFNLDVPGKPFNTKQASEADAVGALDAAITMYGKSSKQAQDARTEVLKWSAMNRNLLTKKPTTTKK